MDENECFDATAEFKWHTAAVDYTITADVLSAAWRLAEAMLLLPLTSIVLCR